MKKNERREAARKVAEAISLLPPDKRSFILGYSQGVIDASKRQAVEPVQNQENSG